MKLTSRFDQNFFGEIIWCLRTSETEVGRRAGLSSGLISKIVRKPTNPTQNTLDQIATALLEMAVEAEMITPDFSEINSPLSNYITDAGDLRKRLTEVQLVQADDSV